MALSNIVLRNGLIAKAPESTSIRGKNMKKRSMLTAGITVLTLLAGTQLLAAQVTDEKMIVRGRYIIATSGCNDCHTNGYAQTDGKIAEGQWLLGSPVGFQGPWGTTYPANLRIVMSNLTEQQWLTRARTPMRPPMPWFNLRDMKDDDLRAIYHFVRSLQPIGEAAPAYAAPGQVVNTPYFEFVPKNLPVTAQAGK